MSVSRKSKNMKKSSKRSKNLRNNKKTKRNLKKMKGGVRLNELMKENVYNFKSNYINILNPTNPKGQPVYVPKTNNQFLKNLGGVDRDETQLEFKNINTDEIFQINADFMDDFDLQQI